MHKRARAIDTMAAAVVVVLAAATGACGSSGQSPPPNCLQVAPCAGDVVGTWSFLGGCTNVAAISDQVGGSCPGSAFTAFGIAITGSITFNADSTYTASNWREDFAAIQTAPLSCTGELSCADGNRTETSATAVSTTTVTTTCAGTSTCTCRTNGVFTVTSDLGYWTTVGAQLTMDGTATSTNLGYCVEENRLHFIGMTTTPTGQSVMASDLVAIRSP